MHIGIIFITISLLTFANSAPKPYFSRTFVQTPSSSFGQYVIVPDKSNAYRVPLSQVHHYSDFQFPKQQVVYFNPTDGTNEHALETLRKDNPVWQEMLLNLHDKSDVNSLSNIAGNEGMEKLKREDSEGLKEPTSGNKNLVEPIVVSSEEYDSEESDSSDEKVMDKKIHITKVAENQDSSAEDEATEDEEKLMDKKLKIDISSTEEGENITKIEETENALPQLTKILKLDPNETELDILNETSINSPSDLPDDVISEIYSLEPKSDITYANNEENENPQDKERSEIDSASKIAQLMINYEMSTTTDPTTDESTDEYLIFSTTEIPQEDPNPARKSKEMSIELVQNANNETEVQLKLIDLTTEGLKELENNLRTVSDNLRNETAEAGGRKIIEPRKKKNSVLIEQEKVDRILRLLEEIRGRDNLLIERPITDKNEFNGEDLSRVEQTSTESSILSTESTTLSTTLKSDSVTSTVEAVKAEIEHEGSGMSSTEILIDPTSLTTAIETESSENLPIMETAADINETQSSTEVSTENIANELTTESFSSESSPKQATNNELTTESSSSESSTESISNNEIIRPEDPSPEVSPQNENQILSNVSRDEMMARLMEMLKEMMENQAKSAVTTSDDLSTEATTESSSDNLLETSTSTTKVTRVNSLIRTFRPDSILRESTTTTKIDETTESNENDLIARENSEESIQQKEINQENSTISEEIDISKDPFEDVGFEIENETFTEVNSSSMEPEIITTESIQTLTESPQNLMTFANSNTESPNLAQKSTDPLKSLTTLLENDNIQSNEKESMESSTSTQNNQFQMQELVSDPRNPTQNISESINAVNIETTEAIEMSSAENVEMATTEAIEILHKSRTLDTEDVNSKEDNKEAQKPLEVPQSLNENNSQQVVQQNLRFGQRIVKIHQNSDNSQQILQVEHQDTRIEQQNTQQINSNLQFIRKNLKYGQQIPNLAQKTQNNEQSTIKSEQENVNVRESRVNKTPTMFLHNNKFYVISGIPEFYANFDAYQNPRTPIFSLQELQPIRPVSNVTVQKIEPFRIYVEDNVDEKSSTQNDNEPLNMQNSTTDNPRSDIENEKPLNVEQQQKEMMVKVKKREQERLPVSQVKRDYDYEEESVVAQANPEALSIAGPRGRSFAGPKASAITGHRGFSQASPQATAIAGRVRVKESAEEEDYDELNDDVKSRSQKRANILKRILKRNRINRNRRL